jgi:hypothetical protein
VRIARLRKREAHTTPRRHGAYHAYSDSCTYVLVWRPASGYAAADAGRAQRAGGGKNPADTPSGGQASCTTPLWRVRTYGGGVSARTPSSIVHRMPRHEAHHARVRGQAGMRAHADDDASCDVLYGGADADAGAEAGSLTLGLVRVRA